MGGGERLSCFTPTKGGKVKKVLDIYIYRERERERERERDR